MKFFIRLAMVGLILFGVCGCTAGLSGISGTKWELSRFCVRSVEQAVVPGTTLAVGPGCTVGGSGGVNQYAVSFTIPAEGQIVWADDFQMTKMMGYGALAEQESSFFMTLPATDRVRYSDTSLEFSTSAGNTVLGFVRARD